jgi:hypothetical protein
VCTNNVRGVRQVLTKQNGTHTHNRDDPKVNLNMEDVKSLDTAIVAGYDDWVKKAPANWKADGLFRDNIPIVVTSRFGQSTEIAVPGNEEEEEHNWNTERDFSKVSFLTFALATSIE